MKDKLQKAIHNNIGLYEAVFDAHLITSSQSGSVWYSIEEAPPLHSNLITTSHSWRPEYDEVLRDVTTKYEKESWRKLSVKDSFNVLDLSQWGFKKLFDATWIYLEAHNSLLSSSHDNLAIVYEVVSNENDFLAWKTRWEANEADILAREIFNERLFANPNVYFMGGFHEDQLVSGCLVNRTDDVLGISNFFAPRDDLMYRSAMITGIHKCLGYADIVGYEQHAESLHPIGFESIGTLSVWLKKHDFVEN